MTAPHSDTPTEETAEKKPRVSGALVVSHDHMAVWYEGHPPSGQFLPIAEVIHDRLIRMKIVDPPEANALADILEKAYEENPDGNEVKLVAGQEPVQSEDGRIEWAADFFNEGYARDEETDSVDFHEPAAQLSVLAGDLIARVIPAKKGKDGFDIFGKRVPIRSPVEPRIRAGENVDFDKATGNINAKADGRFKWSNNTVSVGEVYYIRGDVGPETGNVNHPGLVTVTGDVLDGFKLEAGGDIDVKGIVEGAHVQTTGSLSVRGGIIGAESQRIVVGGDIRARFVVDADIVADGDVAAVSEIVQTSVQCRGAIRIQRGRIVGGSVMALGGVFAGAVGSSTGIPTTVVAGADYSLEGKVLIKEMEVARLRRTIDSYPGRAPAETARLEKELAAREREAEEIRLDSKRRKRPVMEILKAIYPDTTLCIEEHTFAVTERIDGPVVVRIEEGEIRIARRG